MSIEICPGCERKFQPFYEGQCYCERCREMSPLGYSAQDGFIPDEDDE